MKKKMQTFILGVAVLLIWSLVVYRFIDLKNPQVASVPSKYLEPIDGTIKKETKPFEYHMNYSEPFAINQVPQNTTDKAQNLNKPKKKKQIPKKVVWPKITFIGFMSSSSANEKDSYFVEVEDKTETIIDQDSIGDLKIILLSTDSITFEKENEQKVFHIAK